MPFMLLFLFKLELRPEQARMEFHRHSSSLRDLPDPKAALSGFMIVLVTFPQRKCSLSSLSS